MKCRNVWAACMLLISSFLVFSCDKNKGVQEEEVSIKLTYSVEELHIPVNATAEVFIDVVPAERAADVEISVTDDAVATLVGDKEVVSDGRIRLELAPVALGSTSIFAVLDGENASCDVIVDPVAVQSVSLNVSECELAVGSVVTLLATVTPADATNAVVAWSTDKPSEDDKVVEVDNGVITAKKAGETVVTATCGEFSASCKVTVHNVYAESVTFDITSKEISEGETFYIDATVYPDSVTFKVVDWTSSNEEVVTLEPFDAQPEDDILSAKVVSKKEGTAVVTATIDGKSAQCEVTVKKVEVVAEEPKVGDYFYSDGTWSDGGLVSINKDGTNPVWADTKPAPVEGKTVIGIVFQTDPDRISEELKTAGFTKGLVIGVCGLYDKSQMNNPGYIRRCSYTLDDTFGCISGRRRTGYLWYNDIKGKYWTDRVVKYYPGDKLQQCPVFDFAVTDYRLPAPASTSGWYVPAIGELWDFVANLGGDELARYLLQFRDYGENANLTDNEDLNFDVTYYSSLKDPVTDENGNVVKDEKGNIVYTLRYGVKKLSYNPMEKINSAWVLVPEVQRDDLFYCYMDKECQFFSSSIYAREEDGSHCCVFTFGADNSFDFAAGWAYGDPMICHPVLAF